MSIGSCHAIGYVRVSSEDQAQNGMSLEMQRHRIRLYAESRGLQLHPVIFSDEGFSGRRSKNRPGLAGAVDIAIRDKAVLIVFSLSRFARSTRDCIDLSDRLSSAGADLISITESIDTTTSHGRFFFTLLAALAQLESDTLSDRMRAVFAHKRARNEICSGFLPWGQQRSADGKHVEPHAGELATLDKIISSRASGMCWRDLQRLMNEEGIRNRRGKPMSESNLVRLYKKHAEARGASAEVVVDGLRQRRVESIRRARQIRQEALNALLPKPKDMKLGAAAKVIGQIDDFRGDRHDVCETRRTQHGFLVMLGWHHGKYGWCNGGPKVIPTRPLVDLLLSHAHQPANPSLPISKQAIGRIRKMLGINRYTSIADWWSRQGVPGTLADAGAALNRSASAVSQQERRKGKRRLRPAGWWREEPARTILLTKSRVEASSLLNLSVGSVGRYRAAIAAIENPRCVL